MFLLTEHIPEFDKYLIVPCDIVDRVPQDTEFVFDTEDQANEFIQLWFKNPVAAVFAYHCMEAIELAEQS